MTQDEHDAVVASLGDNERAILEETRRFGKASARLLKPVTKAPKTGLPMEYGLTRELGKLQALGLLRPVGRQSVAHYEAVPLADVEEAAKRYSLRRKRATRRRPRKRLEELRVYEKGDYSEFYRVYRRVLELTDYVSQNITKMAFWENAPKDDLARVAKELADLLDAASQALECLKQRADDDDLLAKIEKLAATNGRTPAEVETARSLTKRLRTQYEQRVGL